MIGRSTLNTTTLVLTSWAGGGGGGGDYTAITSFTMIMMHSVMTKCEG